MKETKFFNIEGIDELSSDIADKLNIFVSFGYDINSLIYFLARDDNGIKNFSDKIKFLKMYLLVGRKAEFVAQALDLDFDVSKIFLDSMKKHLGNIVDMQEKIDGFFDGLLNYDEDNTNFLADLDFNVAVGLGTFYGEIGLDGNGNISDELKQKLQNFKNDFPILENINNDYLITILSDDLSNIEKMVKIGLEIEPNDIGVTDLQSLFEKLKEDSFTGFLCSVSSLLDYLQKEIKEIFGNSHLKDDNLSFFIDNGEEGIEKFRDDFNVGAEKKFGTVVYYENEHFIFNLKSELVLNSEVSELVKITNKKSTVLLNNLKQNWSKTSLIDRTQTYSNKLLELDDDEIEEVDIIESEDDKDFISYSYKRDDYIGFRYVYTIRFYRGSIPDSYDEKSYILIISKGRYGDYWVTSSGGSSRGDSLSRTDYDKVINKIKKSTGIPDYLKEDIEIIAHEYQTLSQDYYENSYIDFTVKTGLIYLDDEMKIHTYYNEDGSEDEILLFQNLAHPMTMSETSFNILGNQYKRLDKKYKVDEVFTVEEYKEFKSSFYYQYFIETFLVLISGYESYAEDKITTMTNYVGVGVKEDLEIDIESMFKFNDWDIYLFHNRDILADLYYSKSENIEIILDEKINKFLHDGAEFFNDFIEDVMEW